MFPTVFHTVSLRLKPGLSGPKGCNYGCGTVLMSWCSTVVMDRCRGKWGFGTQEPLVSASRVRNLAKEQNEKVMFL